MHQIKYSIPNRQLPAHFLSVNCAERLRKHTYGLGWNDCCDIKTPTMTIKEEDFRQIFRNLYPDLITYAKTLADEDDVKDLVQEAFVELWKRRDAMENSEHIKAFLYKTVYTRTLNLMRHRQIVRGYSNERKQLELRKMELYHPEHSDVIRTIESKELGNQINAAIDELPEKCRMAFVMSYLHGMKNKEISDVMQISVRTVDTHIFKALRYLRNRLGFLEQE